MIVKNWADLILEFSIDVPDFTSSKTILKTPIKASMS